MAARISDMTLDELRDFVDQRIIQLLKSNEERKVEQILDAIDSHMWTPPPGAKSTLELLREDRDR